MYTVNDYFEVVKLSQARNKMLNAFYLLEDIGANIAFMDVYDQASLDQQKQLMLKLLADVGNLINSESDLLKEKDSNEDIDVSNTILFTKSNDGILHWIGSPTNKFEDAHKHILMEKAHVEFVDRIEKGDIPYPKLLLWHEDDWEIGTTDWVAYDDRGFLVAGGTVYPQYESLVKELQKEPLGMSHGMPIKTVKFQELNDLPGYLGISSYISDEFTVLPSEEAANKLTNWSA